MSTEVALNLTNGSAVENRPDLSPEMAFVLQLVTHTLRMQSHPIEIGTPVPDWRLFMRLVRAHQLNGLLLTLDNRLTELVPDEVLDKLREKGRSNAQKNFRYLTELVRLHRLITRAGVQNYPYKGVLLSKLLFGNYVTRECSDIDFLIDPEDFAKVHELMIADGYCCRHYNPDFRKPFLRSSHELMYVKHIKGFTYKIEIHWAATNQIMDTFLPISVLMKPGNTETLMGHEVRHLDLEAHLLMLLVHHGVNDVWRSLRQCADLAMFVEKYRKEIDWARMAMRARSSRFYYTSCVGFKLIKELFGIETPPEFEMKRAVPGIVRNNLLRYPQEPKAKLSISSFRRQLIVRDSGWDRVRLVAAYIYASITPNVRDMEAVKLPKHLFFVYYLLKPGRMVVGMFEKRGRR